MNSTCNACATGYWDLHCVRACDLRCDLAFGCDKVTGNCIACPAGKVGNLCEADCPSMCLNGTCTLGPTKAAKVCSKGCEKGTFGSDCSKFCLYGCANGSCDRADGSCACRPDYYGATCSSRCPSGCALGQAESANASICALANGAELTCLFGCKPRYSVAKDCRTACPSNCADAPADAPADAGVCNGTSACLFGCKANYFSLPNCSQLCPYSCAESNSTNVSECDGVTGECLLGCKPGRYGPKCENYCPYNCMTNTCDAKGNCLACQPGRGGLQCQINCGNCVVDAARNLTCDESGCSQCVAGRYGKTCQTECGNCADDICSRDGVCVNGCAEGFSNATGKCDTNCPSGCLSSTPQIYRGGACDEKGTCLNGCRQGYSGARCDQYCYTDCIGCSQSGCTECARKAYGLLCRDTCFACERGCDRSGWCAGDCADSRYGASCNYTIPDCRLAFRNATPTDGARCIECARGYGPNCLPCPKNCAPVPPEAVETKPQMCDASGCLHGCQRDWAGARCDMVDTSPDTDAILAGVLPPVIILCIVCAVPITLVCCGLIAKKREAQAASSSNYGNDNANATPMATVFVKQQKPVEQQAAFNSKDQTPL